MTHRCRCLHHQSETLYIDMAASNEDFVVTKYAISERGKSITMNMMMNKSIASEVSGPCIFSKPMSSSSSSRISEDGTSLSKKSGCENEGRTQSANPESSGSKMGKKRTRASRVAPTIVVNTDVSSFRAKVQKFTGMQTQQAAGDSSNSMMPLKPMPKRPLDQTVSGLSRYNNGDNPVPPFVNSGTYAFPSVWPQTSLSNFTLQPLLQQPQSFNSTPVGMHPFFNIFSSNAENNNNSY